VAATVAEERAKTRPSPLRERRRLPPPVSARRAASHASTSARPIPNSCSKYELILFCLLACSFFLRELHTSSNRLHFQSPNLAIGLPPAKPRLALQAFPAVCRVVSCCLCLCVCCHDGVSLYAHYIGDCSLTRYRQKWRW
jgi:hypothetical protein